jgi:hypothetical protein
MKLKSPIARYFLIYEVENSMFYNGHVLTDLYQTKVSAEYQSACITRAYDVMYVYHIATV